MVTISAMVIPCFLSWRLLDTLGTLYTPTPNPLSPMKKNCWFLIPFILSMVIVSCAPSDNDVQESVQKTLSANPGLSPVNASVDKGIVTLTGEVESNELKNLAESSLTGIKGVKSVVNSVTVKPQGPTPEEMKKAADDALLAKVKENFATYKIEGITATVSDSIVTLTGNVKRSNLQYVMKAAMESGATKVENKMAIK
jgi:osmotically-inducible protein OsmY